MPAVLAVGAPGTVVSVSLSLPADNLSDETIDIAYDPAVVTSAGVTVRFADDCTTVSLVPGAGLLHIGVACATFSHPQQVFGLTFRSLSEGTTALHVIRCILQDVNMGARACVVPDETLVVGAGPLRGGPAFVRALALDPMDPGVLYAGTANIGVVKSSDSGATWTVQSAGLTELSALSLAVDPVEPGTVYVGTDNGGVFRSTNAGASWQSRGLDSTLVGTLLVDPTNPQIVYASSLGPLEAGVFKSTDAGADWQMMNDGLASPTVLTLALDAGTPGSLYAGTDGGVFKSTDGAMTWTAMSVGLPPRTVVWSLAAGANVLYAGTSEGLFKSSDNAASWTGVSSGVPSNQIMVVAVDPVQSDTVYQGTTSGASRSTDAGQTWTVMNDLDGLVVRTMTLDPSTPATMYAGTDSGLFTSTDGGDTWVGTRP